MSASNPQSMYIKKQKKPLWEVQDKFLQTFSAEYFRIRDNADHIIFFNNLYARFFARWPEEERLFPGVTKLSGEQTIAVAHSMRVLTRELHNMLKMFLPAYVLINSGTAEDKTIFWESVYSKWFETWPEHDAAIEYRRRMLQKKWATPEQEEFLLSHFPEFRTHALNKHYKDFLKCVEVEWFQRWPERKVSFPDLPAEHVYTTEEEEYIATSRQQIASWFRWQNNPARLGRSAAVRGVLKFDTVLAGGVNLKGTRAPQKIDVYSNKYYETKVKHCADDAIQKEHITNRGPKLNKHREITHRMYSDKSKAVKAKIDKRAIHELGPMLDRVLKYLGHMTGGWKFSVLMGGHDPSTGEVSVFNYHMGEVESGAQFDQAYDKFDGVQSVFLEFVKKSIVFESTLTRESESEMESDDGLLLLDSDSDKEWEKSSTEGGQSQEQEHPGNYLYHMTPQSDEGADLTPTTINAPPAVSHASPAGHTTTTSDASLGFDFQAATATPSDHMDLSVLNPLLNDPIIQGNIDFSVFDPAAFSAVINDPTFDINMLDCPVVPPVNSPPNLPYSTSILLTPEVLLPSVPNEEGEQTNDFDDSPAVPHARHINHFHGTDAPAPSAEQQAPRLRARNNVPFNPRERDNEIGAVAVKGKRRNAEDTSGSKHKRVRRR
ncbi:hypothetical protein EV702DRAFT_1193579 [Suillus placidus]|uniref:Uncharacterized protein n=1 Tax=Suillus placidus TaxID=48579 RepID=A0A9P7A422_9AGAM|nr:hypothetical protein EV702DRAFT_1193579 [Suillus placidus]